MQTLWFNSLRKSQSYGIHFWSTFWVGKQDCLLWLKRYCSHPLCSMPVSAKSTCSLCRVTILLTLIKMRSCREVCWVNILVILMARVIHFEHHSIHCCTLSWRMIVCVKNFFDQTRIIIWSRSLMVLESEKPSGSNNYHTFVSMRTNDLWLQHPFLLLCCPSLKPVSLVHTITIQGGQMQISISVLDLQELKYNGNVFSKEGKYGKFWASILHHTN